MISLERLKRRGDYLEVKGILDTLEKVRELRERLEEGTENTIYNIKSEAGLE